MADKLSRNDVLRGILQTLVDGWGYGAVQVSLGTLEPRAGDNQRPSRVRNNGNERGTAVAQVRKLAVPKERAVLLQALAVRYDEGGAFPTLGDARSFLLSHQRDAKDIKTRTQAFKRMLPLLAQMSEKGLEKVISRSHHSGPAELDPISRAIRGAGETMRGSMDAEVAHSSGEDGRVRDDNPSTFAESGSDKSQQRQMKLKPVGGPGSGGKKSD